MDIADRLYKCFTNIGPKLASAISTVNSATFCSFPTCPTSPTSPTCPTSPTNPMCTCPTCPTSPTFPTSCTCPANSRSSTSPTRQCSAHTELQAATILVMVSGDNKIWQVQFRTVLHVIILFINLIKFYILIFVIYRPQQTNSH